MERDFYTETMPYEHFICRAYQCFPQRKNGAQHSFMQNLMMAEHKVSYVSHLSKFDKQFGVVKNYIDKALKKFLKMNLTQEEHQNILSLQERLESASSSIILMEIVNDGLKVTQRFNS